MLTGRLEIFTVLTILVPGFGNSKIIENEKYTGHC